MTPGARVAAAAEILDQVAGGAPVERLLTGWARASRFAGSKDRRAVRDHVYGAVRRWWSSAWVGGAESGRARMLGALILDGADPDAFFTGDGHAPARLSEAERMAVRDLADAPTHVRADLPQWVRAVLHAERDAAEVDAIAHALRCRAPVHLRANLALTTRAEAAERLAADGIATVPSPHAETALEVQGNANITGSATFRDGLVELQDAASQAVVERLDLPDAGAVLDFCAGGGGKSLALAGRGARVVAHDIDAGRMADIPRRAARAHVSHLIDTELRAGAEFGLVLADAPCSGSGAWRRQPEAKLRLTSARLADLNRMQDEVLQAASAHVSPNGRLAYATCSILGAENEQRIAAFLDGNGGWEIVDRASWRPDQGCDGFFLTVLERRPRGPRTER